MSTGSEACCSLTTEDFKSYKVRWNQEIHHNRELWKAQAAKGRYTLLYILCKSSLFKIFYYLRINIFKERSEH